MLLPLLLPHGQLAETPTIESGFGWSRQSKEGKNLGLAPADSAWVARSINNRRAALARSRLHGAAAGAGPRSLCPRAQAPRPARAVAVKNASNEIKTGYQVPSHPCHHLTKGEAVASRAGRLVSCPSYVKGRPAAPPPRGPPGKRRSRVNKPLRCQVPGLLPAAYLQNRGEGGACGQGSSMCARRAEGQWQCHTRCSRLLAGSKQEREAAAHWAGSLC